MNNLAYLLASKDKQLDEALEYAGRARILVPNNASVLDTYAYVLYKNGEYERAAELFQAALQIYEQDKVSAPAAIYDHLGAVNEKLGLTAEAVAAYEQALKTRTEELSEQEKRRIKAVLEKLRGKME